MSARRANLAAALFFGPLRAGKGRLALALAAIALGVALGYAVQLVNQSAIDEFSQAVQALAGTADLEVRGPRAGFDEALYARVARRPEVAAASPVVEVEVRVAGQRELLRIIGVDVFRAGLVQPDLVASEVSDSLDLVRPDTIFLSPAAAARLDVQAGDTVVIPTALGATRWRVAGFTRAAGPPLGMVDIAGAQAAFQYLGRIHRVDLRLRPGVAIETFRARLQAELPPGVIVERPQASVQRAANLSRSYRVNLNVLALVALFTGGLLVFSTQALAVVRRRAQFALLRVLGLKRRGLLAMLLGEALALGVLGSSIGLLVGYGLARFILRLVGPDLGSGYFRGVEAAVAFHVGGAAVFFALGVIAAVAGCLFPALEAARAAPAQALKAGDEQQALQRLKPAWPGFTVLAAGALLTAAPAIDGLPIFGYVAIALLLVGTLMLMPRLALAAFGALRPRRRAPVQLAVLQLRGAPGQAMLSLATLVASVSLLVSMAIMVASFRSSLDAWLDHVLPADLYVRAGAGDAAWLTPEEQQRLAALPGVRRSEFMRTQTILLAADKSPPALLARSIDARAPERTLLLVSEAVAPGAGEPPPAWVSEAAADLYGYRLGEIITLPIAGRAERFTVAGIWRDYVRTQGAIIIEREVYVRLTADRNVNELALWRAPDADLDELKRALRATLGGRDLDIAEPGEIKRLSLAAFDRTFAVTYVLELVALVIGLFGLSSSFGALVLARRREFGMLRHLGMLRRQIGAMLATEGLLVSALGLAVGLVLGWVISLVLIHVVNRQSFHWSMDLALPWGPLAGFCLLMLGAASLTAFVSARAAMAEDAVQAVKNDW